MKFKRTLQPYWGLRYSAPKLVDEQARKRLLCLHKQANQQTMVQDTHLSSSGAAGDCKRYRLDRGNECGDDTNPEILPDFTQDGEPRPSRYNEWSNQQNLVPRFHPEGISKVDNPTENEINSIEATNGNENQVLDRAITTIINNSDPVCRPSDLTSKRFLVTKLFEFPEFKIEWKQKRIEIGCSRVIINLPVLRQRISSMRFFIFILYPKNMIGTSFQILKSCAIFSALMAGVLGAVTGNFVVAAAVFNKAFKICVEVRIRECYDGGPLVLKVIERDWFDVT